MNFQTAEVPESAFVWYDTQSHGDAAGWIAASEKNKMWANSAKVRDGEGW